MKEKSCSTPSRYVAKMAAGSQPSYAGTTFPFRRKAGAATARVPMMPLNLDKKLEGNERVVTPRGRKQPEAPSLSPSIAGSAQEAVQAAILERLDRMEQNVHSSANTNEGLMASALVKQTEMMEKVFNKPTESRRGVIRIEPKVHWPILTNDDLEVGEFFDESESVCALANDMRGLAPLERLLALKSSLRGSRSETYENAKRFWTENGTFAKDPEGVYETIKGKLLRFRKTYGGK